MHGGQVECVSHFVGKSRRKENMMTTYTQVGKILKWIYEIQDEIRSEFIYRWTGPVVNSR
jgi:hypothetical protein